VVITIHSIGIKRFQSQKIEKLWKPKEPSREKGKSRLVVFAPDLKVAFGVTTHRTFIRCIVAFEDETAISAFPFVWGVFFENFALCNVCQQF